MNIKVLSTIWEYKDVLQIRVANIYNFSFIFKINNCYMYSFLYKTKYMLFTVDINVNKYNIGYITV